MLQLTLNPANDGDCLILSWGNGAAHSLVVDLGRGSTYTAVKQRLQSLASIELFVMTHVDADHIAGAIPMVREEKAPFMPKRVWYNSRPQLDDAQERMGSHEDFGPAQGEKLARGIVHFKWPWNAEFASKVVSTDSPEAKSPIDLSAGLTVRLLSPTDAALVEMLPVWDAELKKAHIRTFDPDVGDDPLVPDFEPFGGAPDVETLAASRFQADTTEPNATSIAFLAECDGQRVLLTGDAHSDILEAAIAPLAAAEGGRLRVDLYKMGHHGSQRNTSKGLLKMLDCTRFAISTDGTRHGHPDPETIARVLSNDPERSKTLYFNYRKPMTDQWDNRQLKNKWKYETVFPSTESNGTLEIDV